MIRDRGYEFIGEIVGIRDHHQQRVAAYSELEFVSLTEFLEDGYHEYLSTFDFAIQLTNRVTSGRVSADFAGVGVPVIGNKHNDLQHRCWPELSIEPYDFEAAVSLAERLLTNERFYRRVVDHAQTAVTELQDHSEATRQLLLFFDSVSS